MTTKLMGKLRPSGPVSSTHDGQVIFGLDVSGAQGLDAITITHSDVIVVGCKVTHTGGVGIRGDRANNLTIQDVHVINAGAPAIGAELDTGRNNIQFENCWNLVVDSVRLEKGSSGVYLLDSPNSRLSNVDGWDFRGPMARGQLVQWNRSPRGRLVNFSVVNNDITSWPEDCVSVFYSNDVYISTGVVDGNNSTTGAGVMVEASSGVVVEDVDSVRQSSVSFCSASGSQGTIFRRCRATLQRNEDLGRGPLGSNSLSFGSFGISDEGVVTAGTRFENCVWHNQANPSNIYWNAGTIAFVDIVQQNFTPRSALDLSWSWTEAHKVRVIQRRPLVVLKSAPNFPHSIVCG